jgi:hypothetical protein
MWDEDPKDFADARQAPPRVADKDEAVQRFAASARKASRNDGDGRINEDDIGA